MTWKEIVADYFTFTRRDRIAVLVLIGAIAAIFFLPKFTSPRSNSSTPSTDTSWIAAIKKSEKNEGVTENNIPYNDDNTSEYQYDRTKNNYYTAGKGELFYFDPNTLSDEGWAKLGIRKKTVHTIQNYLAKGGRFKKPEDVKKIYGLFPDEYDRISPYIRITSDNQPAGVAAYTPEETRPAKIYAPRYSVIDINTADTTAFITLPGIGSKLAARIINFRDKLGGFYSINQVGETFGLPDSTFQKIKQYLKTGNGTVRKLNINTATVDELKTHPYIRYSIANPIVAYRNEHGPFGKIEDIKKVMVVTEEVYNKIAPYLSLE